MKTMLISTACGLLGAIAFLLGAASSSGGYFAAFAIPANLLQYAVNDWGLSLTDVQLNRWGLIVQFISYFLIAIILIGVKNILGKKT